MLTKRYKAVRNINLRLIIKMKTQRMGVLKWQRTTISIYQLSIYQLSIINYQLSIINYQLVICNL
jgi:hypothetical protein